MVRLSPRRAEKRSDDIETRSAFNHRGDSMPRLSLEDRSAIEDLFARYSWALGTGDVDGFAATFTPDGCITEDVFEEPDVWKGRDAIRAMLRHYANSPNFPGRQHHVSMPLYQPEGDRCRVKSFLYVTECHGEPPYQLRLAGSYTDELIKENGEWLFQSRIIRRWAGEVLKNFPGHGERAPLKRPPDLVVRR
jgi:hypothetical protein